MLYGKITFIFVVLVKGGLPKQEVIDGGRSSDISVDKNRKVLALMPRGARLGRSVVGGRNLVSYGDSGRWDVSDAGGGGIEYIGAERSSWGESRGRGISEKGRGDCRFPTITELSELRPPRPRTSAWTRRS